MATRTVLWSVALTDQCADLADYEGELWLQTEHEDTGQGACLLTDAQAQELERQLYLYRVRKAFDRRREEDEGADRQQGSFAELEGGPGAASDS